MKRYLILEDGSSYKGDGIGAAITATGELAVQTSNYGYQEVLTDPANAGKIIVFTTPMIGSNGINAVDYESMQPSVKGVIANDVALNITDNDNFQSLADFLKEKGVPAIFNVDTRALVRKLQKQGTIKASIMDTDDAHAFDQIRALVLPKNKSALVSTKNAYAAPNVGKTIAVIDLGLKHTMLRELSLRQINANVLPYNAEVRDLKSLRPDGIIISNGPGQSNEVMRYLSKILDAYLGQLPILGVGLGFLAIADYLDMTLVDLPQYQNGTNFPVISQTEGQIWQTAMNIGQLVLPDDAQLTFNEEYFDLHTELLAGFTNEKMKLMAVAFNPEGAPGALDGRLIFDDFLKLVK